MRLVGADDFLTVAIPEVLLVSALRNLLDNTLRFAQPNTVVGLKVDWVGVDRIRFRVLDRGPGSTEAECGQATERVWRRTKTPYGSGLGLSIASAIAKRYGGGLRLAPRAEGGLQAELTLPISAVCG